MGNIQTVRTELGDLVGNIQDRIENVPEGTTISEFRDEIENLIKDKEGKWKSITQVKTTIKSNKAHSAYQIGAFSTYSIYLLAITVTVRLDSDRQFGGLAEGYINGLPVPPPNSESELSLEQNDDFIPTIGEMIYPFDDYLSLSYGKNKVVYVAPVGT